ncbi:MAG TPA: hypothetical protein VFH51_02315, partial [Myxococcota bacterium]|nr:hypothetical protein [Myxococcota bacterium]
MRAMRALTAKLPAALACAAALAATCVDGATTHQPAFVLRLVVLGLALIAWPRPAGALRGDEAMACGLALAGAALGVALAPNPGLALQPAINIGLVVLLFAALRHQPVAQLDALGGVAVGIGVVHALWAVGQHLAVGGRGHGGFFSPNDAAAFFAPLAVACACEALAARGRRREFVLGAAVALGAGMGAAASRGGVLGVVV